MRALALICALILSVASYGQRKNKFLYVSGTVLGYHYEPKGFFKSEQVEIQGSLSDVQIKCTHNGEELASASTNSGGSFDLYIPLNFYDELIVTYSKDGYAKSAISIGLGLIPEEMFSYGLVLENIELILNDNQTDFAIDNGKPFAKITYSRSRVFVVDPVSFEKNDRLFKKIENSTPVNLLTRSVDKNRKKNLEAKKTSSNNGSDNVSPNDSPNDNNDTIENVELIVSKPSYDTTYIEETFTVLKSEKFDNVSTWENLTFDDIDAREDEITNAWEQLEKDKLEAVTEQDFILLEAREALLLSAERELDAARAYIEEQESKLNAQRNFMFVLGFMVLVLAGFVVYLIRSIREKNRLNSELDKRNQKITASISYAERIQKSVLLRDEDIKAILPNSFVYYSPLDVVSGDFYWFSEVNGKAVVAAVDCTGHGVPGAFMSLIGNTLMNQIVNEKKITEPSKILNELHNGIVKSLNQEEDAAASQDGMDMSICVLDKSSGELSFAGAVNPIYVVEEGEVKEISGDIIGVGGVMKRKKKREINFSQQNFNFKKGTNVYMFSDGYMDQFGGANNEKFNIPRFKEMLLSIKDEPIEKQKDQVIQTLNKWKGQSKQVDDILVIGIQI